MAFPQHNLQRNMLQVAAERPLDGCLKIHVFIALPFLLSLFPKYHAILKWFSTEASSSLQFTTISWTEIKERRRSLPERRLRWHGHILQRGETRMAKQLLSWKEHEKCQVLESGP